MAKAQRKVYNSIGFLNATTQIMVNGKKMTIEFRGGARYPKVTFGQFVTDDKDVQKALEKDKQFNKLYKLVKIDGEFTEPVKVVLSPEAQVKKLTELNANLQKELQDYKENGVPVEDKKIIEAYKIQVTEQAAEIEKLKGIVKELEDKLGKEPVKEQEPNIYPDVLNMQGARDVLIKDFDVEVNRLPNRKAVLNKAKMLNVQFPNWKK